MEDYDCNDCGTCTDCVQWARFAEKLAEQEWQHIASGNITLNGVPLSTEDFSEDGWLLPA